VATPTPVSYLITATAIGNQANDTKCATFMVDHLGSQTSTGTETAATCWGN
jgi:type IV pilus assembly protein PilE